MDKKYRSFLSACVDATLVAVLGLGLGMGALTGCGDDDYGYYDECRFQPELCTGAPGALCDSDIDCDPGFDCCTEQSNCGGGMCTMSCRDDFDCPPSMACQHDLCFFRCDSDFDCADGQSCEHGRTVCEWP